MMTNFLIRAIEKLNFWQQPKPEPETNRVWITKDSTGQWWFLGIYSNKYMDRDGEIIPESGHKEYIDWLKRTGFKPMITAYHQPQMPFGFWGLIFDKFGNDGEKLNQIVRDVFKDFGFAQADRVTYLNGFTVVVAKVLPGKEEIAERLSKIKNLGMSHGFIVTESDGIYLNEYRSFEMSALRAHRAANLLTRSTLLEGGAMGKQKDKQQKGLTKEDRADLVAIFGDEVISKLETDSATAEPILDKLLAHKSALMDESKADEKEVEEDKAMDEDMMDEEDEEKEDKKSDVSVEPVQKLASEIAEVFKGLQPILAEMQSKIDALEKANAELKKALDAKADAEEVQSLKKTEDEKIADAFLPRIDWRGGYSATKADDNLLDADTIKRVKQNAPSANGAKPTDNFLDEVFWKSITGGAK